MEFYPIILFVEGLLAVVANILCFIYIHKRPPQGKTNYYILLKWLRIIEAIPSFMLVLLLPKPLFPALIVLCKGPIIYFGSKITSLALGSVVMTTEFVVLVVALSFIVRHNVLVSNRNTFDLPVHDKLIISVILLAAILPFLPYWYFLDIDQPEYTTIYLKQYKYLQPYMNQTNYIFVAYGGQKIVSLIFLIIKDVFLAVSLMIYVMARKHQLYKFLKNQTRTSRAITQEQINSIKYQLNITLFVPAAVIYGPVFCSIGSIFIFSYTEYADLVSSVASNFLLVVCLYFLINPLLVYYYLYVRGRARGSMRSTTVFTNVHKPSYLPQF